MAPSISGTSTRGSALRSYWRAIRAAISLARSAATRMRTSFGRCGRPSVKAAIAGEMSRWRLASLPREAATSRSSRPSSRRRRSCPCGPDRTDIPCRECRCPRRSRCNSAIRRAVPSGQRRRSGLRQLGQMSDHPLLSTARDRLLFAIRPISLSCPSGRTCAIALQFGHLPVVSLGQDEQWSCSRAICPSCLWDICDDPVRTQFGQLPLVPLGQTLGVTTFGVDFGLTVLPPDWPCGSVSLCSRGTRWAASAADTASSPASNSERKRIIALTFGEHRHDDPRLLQRFDRLPCDPHRCPSRRESASDRDRLSVHRSRPHRVVRADR